MQEPNDDGRRVNHHRLLNLPGTRPMSHDFVHELVERLTQPRRIGLFGLPGVGPTLFLEMLNREARNTEGLTHPACRLLPNRGIDTPHSPANRFNLYRGDSSVELVLLDYAATNTTGSDGRSSSHAFVRSCDAVLICLLGHDAEPLHAEWEIEQLIADYLAAADDERPHRPIAVMRAKADSEAGEQGVSTPRFTVDLEQPLLWLADVLHRADAARIAHLFRICNDGLSLERALSAFRASYPSDPLGTELASAVPTERQPQLGVVRAGNATDDAPQPAVTAPSGSKGLRWGVGIGAAVALLALWWLCDWYPIRTLLDKRASEALTRPARPETIEKLETLAREYGGLPVSADIEKRRHEASIRLDDRDAARAEAVTADEKAPFADRHRAWLEYLDRHPQGRSSDKARREMMRLGREWDRADYRQLRDRYKADPGAVEALRTAGQAYLATHRAGAFRDPVTALLRWCDQVSEPGEYHVKLLSGVFDNKSAFWASRGLSVSLTLEVGGKTYGPSPIITTTTPKWDYDFGRRIRWKSGDSVRIIVKDHYFWKRTIADQTFTDPLAMVRLSGLIDFKNGSVRFESDFTLPLLPEAN